MLLQAQGLQSLTVGTMVPHQPCVTGGTWACRKVTCQTGRPRPSVWTHHCPCEWGCRKGFHRQTDQGTQLVFTCPGGFPPYSAPSAVSRGHALSHGTMETEAGPGSGSEKLGKWEPQGCCARPGNLPDVFPAPSCELHRFCHSGGLETSWRRGRRGEGPGGTCAGFGGAQAVGMASPSHKAGSLAGSLARLSCWWKVLGTTVALSLFPCWRKENEPLRAPHPAECVALGQPWGFTEWGCSQVPQGTARLEGL